MSESVVKWAFVGRRFLLADLSMINRTVTPWLVVNLHRPIYTSSASGKSYTSVLKVAEDLRLALEDLFFLYQVGLLRFSEGDFGGIVLLLRALTHMP